MLSLAKFHIYHLPTILLPFVFHCHNFGVLMISQLWKKCVEKRHIRMMMFKIKTICDSFSECKFKVQSFAGKSERNALKCDTLEWWFFKPSFDSFLGCKFEVESFKSVSNTSKSDTLEGYFLETSVDSVSKRKDPVPELLCVSLFQNRYTVENRRVCRWTPKMFVQYYNLLFLKF